MSKVLGVLRSKVRGWLLSRAALAMSVARLVLVGGFLPWCGYSQSILVVPTQFPTIPSAIIAAVDGDVVQVLPGIYSQPIDMLGKRIELRSSSGAAVTILDGQNLFPVIRLSGAETDQTVIEGFTIRNGLGALTTWPWPFGGGTTIFRRGGGILGAEYVASNGITVRNCIIRDNVAATGAGLFMAYFNTLPLPSGRVVVEDCEFINNSCSGVLATTQELGDGVALSVVRCQLSMKRCRVTGSSLGGTPSFTSSAVRIVSDFQAEPLISESEISQNSCRASIYLGSPGSSVVRTLIAGGEVGVDLLDGALEQCVIEGQSVCGVETYGYGGIVNGCVVRNSLIGVWASSFQDYTALPPISIPQTKILNSVIVDNAIGMRLTQYTWGSGYLYWPIISGCSIVNSGLQTPMPPNLASASGAGVYVDGTPTAEFQNCIIYGNPNGSILGSGPSSFGSIVVSTCNIQGGWGGAGGGTIDLPPQFVDPLADFHLQLGSPCIDSGGSYPLVGDADLDAEPRVLHGAPDIGADEFLIAPTAAHGTIGAAAPSGQPERVLSVNGSSGTYGGLVDLGVAEPIQLVLSQPSSHALPSNFVLWMKLEIPAPSEVTPTAFGDLAFLPYHADPAGSGSGVLADTFFVDPAAFVGVQAPAPFGFSHPGLPFPLTVTIQGAMEDTGASGPTVAVTNTIVLRIQ